MSSNKHRTTLKGERGAERVLVLDAKTGAGSLWAYGDKPRSRPVLDVQVVDNYEGADQVDADLDVPKPPRRSEIVTDVGQLGGVRPLTAADHARTQAHLRKQRDAGGTVAKAVGETLTAESIRRDSAELREHAAKHPTSALAHEVFEHEVRREADAVVSMLLRKNAAYGDSALNPIRVFSRASVLDGLAMRMDDKLSRLARGEAAGEDAEEDLLDYLLLRRVARARARLAGSEVTP